MAKSNRPGVFEIANRVVNSTAAGEISVVADDLSNHQNAVTTDAHQISNISGLQTVLNGKQNVISGYTGTIDIIVSVDFANQKSETAKINVSNGIIISIN